MSSKDDVCLGLVLVEPLKTKGGKSNEINDFATRRTREQIIHNNEVYCKFCPEYNKICKK